MEDPNSGLVLYFLCIIFFLVYSRYYNNLRRLSPLRGTMLLGMIEKNHINTEKIELFESKMLSLQIGRIVFLVPFICSYQFIRFPVSFPVFLLFSSIFVFIGEFMLPAFSNLQFQEKTLLPQSEIRFINILAGIFLPITFPLFMFRETWFRLTGKKAPPYPEHWLEDEIRAIIKVGEQEGIFKETEKELLQGIIDFGDTIVREVMTPRTDIAFISSEDSIFSLRQLIVKVGHSRIPVFHEKIDDIIGIAFAKDILRCEPQDFKQLEIKSLMREPTFVPETKKVRELLAEFRKNNIHLAVVVDEYGGVAGLVTLEDLIEEIVGEIRDEYDQEAEPIQELNDGNLLVDGKTNIDQLEDYYKVALPHDDFDTIGGFIINQLGRVPKTGEKLRYENLEFEVVGAEARRIEKIKIIRSDIADSEIDAD